MGNVTGDSRNQLLQPTGLGSIGLGQPQGPGYGSPVNPDGSFQRSDGTVDWAVGTGPKYNWGGEDQKTGQQPISAAPPEPDSVASRGTPQWRQAYDTRQQWIAANRAQGRTLADLGMAPEKGGGLSDYMKYSNTPRGTVGAGPTSPMQPGGNMPDPRGGIAGSPTGIQNTPGMSSIFGPASAQPQVAQKRKGVMIPGPTRGYGNPTLQSQLGRTGPMNSLGMSQFGQQPNQQPNSMLQTPLRMNRVGY